MSDRLLSAERVMHKYNEVVKPDEMALNQRRDYIFMQCAIAATSALERIATALEKRQ